MALAPWQGGSYERLVGLTKRSLRKALGRKMLRLDQLQTLIVEIEAIINTRPLTYVHDDFLSGIALTPANLMINRPLSLPSFPVSDDDEDYHPQPDRLSSAETLLQTWKKGQRHLEQFLQVWQNECLPSMRERNQLLHKGSRSERKSSPVPGEVVVVKEEGRPRGTWQLACVM